MDDNEIQQKVQNLIFSNLTQGYSKLLGKDYCYIKPSPSMYPFQFFWDTSFHVFMLLALGEYELAKRNMESLFAMQEPNGFSGHMIFWESVLPTNKRDVLQARPTLGSIRPHMSALIQPPLVAQAVLKIYEQTKDIEFVRNILPKIKKYFHWLNANRNFDGDGMISIISPFESGIDWKPSFDPVVGFSHRKGNSELYARIISVDAHNFFYRYDLTRIYQNNYFVVKEVNYNTNYIHDLRALSDLCKIVKDKEEKVFRERAEKALRRMLEIMYDEESQAFYDVYSHTNEKIKINTFTIFLPISLSGVSSEISKKILEKHLFNKHEFWLPYPVPSTAKNEPAFNPYHSSYIWRGPTWVYVNWYIYKCLQVEGYKKEAALLLESLKKLITQSGFREYYNPFTGEGYGEKNFTWSGLILDMMKE